MLPTKNFHLFPLYPFVSVHVQLLFTKTFNLIFLLNHNDQLIFQTLLIKPKYSCDDYIATSISSLSNSTYICSPSLFPLSRFH